MRASILAVLAALALPGVALGGCGGAGGDVASATMALGTDGLSPSDVGAVEILVLAGDQANCKHVLSLPSALDDASLEVVAHALFTVDGAAKHLTIPAGRPLAFDAYAYRSMIDRTQIGRGCAEGELGAGSSRGITITLTATGD